MRIKIRKKYIDIIQKEIDSQSESGLLLTPSIYVNKILEDVFFPKEEKEPVKKCGICEEEKILSSFSYKKICIECESHPAKSEQILITKKLRAYFYYFVKYSSISKYSDLVGCTKLELKKHIQKQFKPGMKWKNHGTHGWHIDHIKPCASFDLTDPEQQKECFHYTNLQPLWAEENREKSDKLDWVKNNNGE